MRSINSSYSQFNTILPLVLPEENQAAPTAAAQSSTPENTSTAQTDNNKSKFPVPDFGRTQIQANDNVDKYHWRQLYDAAHKAGLPKGEAAKFADDYYKLNGSWTANDPTPDDNSKARQTDIKAMIGRTATLNLSPEYKKALEQRQNDYIRRGGVLGSEKDAPPANQTGVNQTDSTNRAANDPNAPKMIPGFVTMPKEGGATKDRALFWHVKDRFGGGNFEIDNFEHISERAKQNGVNLQITNVQPLGAKIFVAFKMTATDAAKLKQIADQEQTKVNTDIETVNNAVRDTVAQRFAKGFFAGAYNDLKANAAMVYTAASDPLGTAWKIGEALTQIPQLATKIGAELGKAAIELAKLTPDQRQALIDELISKGHKELLGMPVPEAAEKAGEIVGTLAMEAVLGKGAGLVLDCLKGTAFAGKIAELAKAAKTAIAETKVPVRATILQPATELGQVGLPKLDVETKKLGDVISTMEARAKQVLSGGKKVEELSGVLTGSFFGKTEQQILRHAPKDWKKVSVERGNGWRLIDQNGVERIRFMRPVNETTVKWERMKNG